MRPVICRFHWLWTWCWWPWTCSVTCALTFASSCPTFLCLLVCVALLSPELKLPRLHFCWQHYVELLLCSVSQWLIDVSTLRATSCIFLRNMASDCSFCDAAVHFIFRHESIGYVIEDSIPATNDPPKTYLSYSWGRKRVFIHGPSTYCKGHTFVVRMKRTIYISFFAIILFKAWGFKMWFISWTCDGDIHSVTLSHNDLTFRERCSVNAAAAVFFIEEGTSHISGTSWTQMLSHAVLRCEGVQQVISGPWRQAVDTSSGPEA